MNNGPYGPTPGPYDPNANPNAAPLAPSSYGYGGPGQGPGGMPPDDTMAWAGIICSSLGWFTCCCWPIPILGFLGMGGGFLLSVAGVVCGYLALQKAKQAQTRTDLAMIGIVLGAVRLGLMVLFIIIAVAAVMLGVGVGVLEGITHPH